MNAFEEELQSEHAGYIATTTIPEPDDEEEDFANLTLEQAIERLKAVNAFVARGWADLDLREYSLVNGKELLQLISGT